MYLTVADAYPVLERAFLRARHSIKASFRIFDLCTRLRSDEARQLGRDRFDLLLHTLRRGVRVRIVLSDFGPIGADHLHRLCWGSRRKFAAAADLAGGGLDARYGEHLQTRCLDVLKKAFGPERLLVVSPVQPRPHPGDGRETLEGAPVIYVHSKLSIFEDSAAILSSANLNGRSLRWDTGAGLELTAPEHETELSRRAMGHWLPRPVDAAALAPATAFSRWAALAERNASAAPQDRRGFLLPYGSAPPARDLALPVPGAPEAMV